MRASAAGIATIIGVLGIAIGNLLPTFLIPDYSDTALYALNAAVFTIIGLIFFFLMIPDRFSLKEV